MTSSDFAALLLAIALVSYLHARGPVNVVNDLLALFG